MTKAATTTVSTYTEAVETLQGVGIIQTPTYWYNAQKTINYIDTFMINSANAVYTTEQNNITDINSALIKIKDKGVISDTTYWSDACIVNKYLSNLIISIAKYV